MNAPNDLSQLDFHWPMKFLICPVRQEGQNSQLNIYEEWIHFQGGNSSIFDLPPF